MTKFQPRNVTGHFATNGESPHEKHRFYASAAHLRRVHAAVARHNGDLAGAESNELAACELDRLGAAHLASGLLRR